MVHREKGRSAVRAAGTRSDVWTLTAPSPNTRSTIQARSSVGPNSDIWFGEQIANKIGRLTTDGMLTEFPVPTTGTLKFKHCTYESSGPGEGYILFGPDGNSWFTESVGNKIVKMTLDGHMQEFDVPTPDSGPLTLALGPDGALWFVERQASKTGDASGFLAPGCWPHHARRCHR